MGGYIFTTGSLTVFISFTSFRKRASGAFNSVAVAGISSIGLLSVVNFMIGSDFKWLLLTFTLPWIIFPNSLPDSQITNTEWNINITPKCPQIWIS